MPPQERESTSLFMLTDGQFWKFHGLKGMRLSIQTDKTVLSWGTISVQEAALAGSPVPQATLPGRHSQEAVVQSTWRYRARETASLRAWLRRENA